MEQTFIHSADKMPQYVREVAKANWKYFLQVKAALMSHGWPVNQ